MGGWIVQSVCYKVLIVGCGSVSNSNSSSSSSSSRSVPWTNDRNIPVTMVSHRNPQAEKNDTPGGKFHEW